MSVLAQILASTREDLERRRDAVALGSLEPARTRAPGAFRAALAAPGLSIIAEHKRRSPSAGEIRPGSSVAEIVAAYERAGAAAISVLTEERHFDGSLDDLREAAGACALPLLRKDFILDPYQLHEAAAAGASAVLLIVAALEQPQLCALHAAAQALSLDVLVEVHDRAELSRALAAGAAIIGVNNRDLHDFSVDVGRTFELAPLIPPGVLVVSESGISTSEQLRALREHDVDAALLGEHLMRAADPARALELLRSGAQQGSR